MPVMQGKCPGSGMLSLADWPPEGDYPGASVCPECSGGVTFLKRSIQQVTTTHGAALAGVLRVHRRAE